MPTEAKKRPFGFRLLLAQTGLIVIRSGGRIWFALANIGFYHDLQATPPLILYIGSNLAWGVVFLLITINLWRRQRAALKTIWRALVAYTIFEVIWFAAFAQTAYDQGRLGFIIFMATLILLIDFGLIHRPQFRDRFGEQHGGHTQD